MRNSWLGAMTEIYQEQIVDTSNPEGVENG